MRKDDLAPLLIQAIAEQFALHPAKSLNRSSKRIGIHAIDIAFHAIRSFFDSFTRHIMRSKKPTPALAAVGGFSRTPANKDWPMLNGQPIPLGGMSVQTF